MTNILVRLITLIVVVGVSASAGIFAYKHFADRPTQESKHQLSIEKIQQMGKLELVRITIKDVLEHKLIRSMPLPDAKALLIVVGEVAAGIDLKQVVKTDIVESDNQITITLPKPQILMSKINHNKSKIYDVSKGLWNTLELVDEAYRAAETAIRQTAIETGYVETCKKNARELLTPIFDELSRKKVVIDFKR